MNAFSTVLMIGSLVIPPAPARETAVFAGGCFWGVDAVFKHVKGVTRVVSGYAGGDAATADYQQVSTGATGHAESVEITFDPTQVSYERLLEIFFAVAHDPTQLNRQGPDVGTQYRSAIFYTSEQQKTETEAFIARLARDRVYSRPIVTQVVALDRFYRAEEYHQNYLARHPTQAYIVYHDLPKLAKLKAKFPELWRD
jgi:peptide-methionine (S)-S-oxide reductase